jgi:hypothetical protein
MNVPITQVKTHRYTSFWRQGLAGKARGQERMEFL